MNEARYELKNWKKWKRTIELLIETKEQVMDMRRSISFTDSVEMPGGSHRSIHEKMERIINDCDQYELIIEDYKFLVNRLENSINKLLSKDEKDIVLIYANNPDNVYKREMLAYEHGYGRTTYYNLLTQAMDKINVVLVPSNKDIKKQIMDKMA